MHINKHVHICLDCVHKNGFTESSIPLTKNYMYLSIDKDMGIDIRFQIQNQIPTSLQKPAELPSMHDRDRLHKWASSLILIMKTSFPSVCRTHRMPIKIKSAKSIKGESVNIRKTHVYCDGNSS